MADAADFYDGLAARYHLLFEDWWAAARHHGEVIAHLLSTHGTGIHRVLDATCGIGTQALPLARLGYRVTGTDVSADAIARARDEAAARGLEVELEVRDVRDAVSLPEGAFDAVIACDNALPHLLTDDDLARALAGLHHCLRPSGLLLASIRDYDALRERRPAGVPVSIHGTPGSRHAVGQAWQWSDDGEYVDIELLTLRETPAGSWSGESASTRYRALRRATLQAALTDAGFEHVEWLTPEASGYYQPVVVATRSTG